MHIKNLLFLIFFIKQLKSSFIILQGNVNNKQILYLVFKMVIRSKLPHFNITQVNRCRNEFTKK